MCEVATRINSTKALNDLDISGQCDFNVIYKILWLLFETVKNGLAAQSFLFRMVLVRTLPKTLPLMPAVVP